MSKKANDKLSKEAVEKMDIMSRLINTKAFSPQLNWLQLMFNHKYPAILQSIQRCSIKKSDTVDEHWKMFTDTFKTTDEGMRILLDTLEKYNREPLHKRNRHNYTFSLLERATKLYAQKKAGVYEMLAFVALSIYEGMSMQRVYDEETFIKELQSHLIELWPEKDFIINDKILQYFPMEIPESDTGNIISKYFAICATIFFYFLYQGDIVSIRNMPYSNFLNDLFPDIRLGEKTYWITDEPSNIWYVFSEQSEHKGIGSTPLIAVFEPCMTKCLELHLFIFMTKELVMDFGSLRKFHGFYRYKIADDGRSIAFENCFGNTHELPGYIYRSSCETDDRIRFLKDGLDTKSIFELLKISESKEITDVTISRTHITIVIPDDVKPCRYIMCREKCPDLHRIHPDTPAYFIEYENSNYVFFKGEDTLLLALEDFEPLTNEMIIKQLGLDE